ncbi:transcription termination/antitermination protein NusG [Thauera mechernichensis]
MSTALTGDCPRSSELVLPRGWYVVLTKPRAEEQARTQLLNQGYEVWLPMLTTWRKVAGTWTQKTSPFFPRYLFVRPSHEGQSIAPIRSTLGVSAVVRFGIEPARLSEALFADLQRLVEAHAQRPDLRTSPFSAGDSVSVTGGPLAGLAGIVTCSALERVTVLLQLLGREKEVVLQPDMLTKAA